MSLELVLGDLTVQPVDAIKKRMTKEQEATISDEERRHQELLAALRERSA